MATNLITSTCVECGHTGEDILDWIDAPYTDGFTVEPFTGHLCTDCSLAADLI